MEWNGVIRTCQSATGVHVKACRMWLNFSSRILCRHQNHVVVFVVVVCCDLPAKRIFHAINIQRRRRTQVKRLYKINFLDYTLNADDIFAIRWCWKDSSEKCDGKHFSQRNFHFSFSIVSFSKYKKWKIKKKTLKERQIWYFKETKIAKRSLGEKGKRNEE